MENWGNNYSKDELKFVYVDPKTPTKLNIRANTTLNKDTVTSDISRKLIIIVLAKNATDGMVYDMLPSGTGISINSPKILYTDGFHDITKLPRFVSQGRDIFAHMADAGYAPGDYYFYYNDSNQGFLLISLV